VLLPFADAATRDLPLAGCCACRCSRCRSAWPLVLLTGTLNRVMIVELGVPPGWWR
jgi:MFS transporter, BCD family, chlorophyll transporter